MKWCGKFVTKALQKKKSKCSNISVSVLILVPQSSSPLDANQN